MIEKSRLDLQSQFLINLVIKKSQNKIRIHITKKHRYNINQTTLIPNNLTVMMDLIILVETLGNPYKISITTRTHYVRLLRRVMKHT